MNLRFHSSASQAGSEFHDNEPADMEPSFDSPTPRAAPLRLAVVDDHAIIRGVFVTLVEDAPDLAMAWMASSLSEARDRLLSDPPDFLVMDVNLPDGNGFDFTSEALRRIPGLPVLIVSAEGNKTYSERAALCGARGYIAKEASLDQLVEAVNTVQAGRRWFQ